MNIGTISCLVMGCIFLIMTVIFALLKEKAAILISGFNSIDKEERQNYDQERMAKDMRNQLLLWTVIFGVGALLCMYRQNIVYAVYIIWLILFFKDVHLDEEKAFGKYKKGKSHEI